MGGPREGAIGESVKAVKRVARLRGKDTAKGILLPSFGASRS